MAWLSLTRKKKPAPDAAQAKMAAEAGPLTGTIFRAMPMKFRRVRPPSRRFWSAPKIWLIVILLVAGLVGLTYWLVSGIPNGGGEQPLEQTGGQPQAPTLPPSILPGTSAPTNEEAPPIEPSEAETPDAAGPLAAVLPSAVDVDRDGLTDTEEGLYRTDLNRPDSDADGYTDLQELQNGFNPTGAGRLAPDTLFASYTSDSGAYQVSYPSTWEVRDLGNGGVQVVTATGGAVTVVRQENASGQNLVNWYRGAISEAGGEAVIESAGSHRGIYSADRQAFYFVAPEQPTKVFVVTLTEGTATSLTYRATFALIIASLDVIAAE